MRVGLEEQRRAVFHQILKDKNLSKEIKAKLAREFQVADSTVERWINGVAKPHPLMQEAILKFIEEHG